MTLDSKLHAKLRKLAEMASTGVLGETDVLHFLLWYVLQPFDVVKEPE